MLHDALEVCSNVDDSVLVADFGLSEEELEVIDILTAKNEESSYQHFNRVLYSGNDTALIIKYYDCLDNSEFTLSDYTFTSIVLGLDPKEEIEKYQNRSKQLAIILKVKGIIV